MLGHFGFSYVGLIYLLMLFIPNIIWSKHKPIDYDASNENKILSIFEKIGQVLCTCIVLIFSDFNIREFSSWSIWLIISFILMILYEIAWIRYFSNEHTEKNFYKEFYKIPIPLATLPVIAFLLLGIYGKVYLLVIASVILGIGHIGIHLEHFKGIR